MLNLIDISIIIYIYLMSQEWMDQIKNTSKACNFFKGLVVSSAQIQQNFMEKYNISVAEFLRPFVQSRQVKMKLAMREKNYPDFNVTLYDREEYNAISKEHLNETLRSVLKEVVPDQNVSITKQWKSRSSVDSMIEANPT